MRGGRGAGGRRGGRARDPACPRSGDLPAAPRGPRPRGGAERAGAQGPGPGVARTRRGGPGSARDRGGRLLLLPRGAAEHGEILGGIPGDRTDRRVQRRPHVLGDRRRFGLRRLVDAARFGPDEHAGPRRGARGRPGDIVDARRRDDGGRPGPGGKGRPGTGRGGARPARARRAIAVGLAIGAGAFLVISWSTPPPEGAFGFRGFAATFAITFGTVGALVASRQPRNPIGWIALASGIAPRLP